MKRRFLITIILLAVVIFSGVGFVGCDWLSGLDPNHEHKPSSSWQGDSVYHWHRCVGIGCSEQIDKEEHTLEHVEAKPVTCTEDGNVEYWYCTGCQKYYSSADARTEIKSVEIRASGHQVVIKHDEEYHWKECETCHTVILSSEAHSSSTYVKSKQGHYKICSVCKVKFDEGTHVDGKECKICGYTPDYAEISASDYGYNYLGTLADGESLQSYYTAMDGVVKAFHSNGAKNATSVSVESSVVYVAGEVNYSSLGLSIEQAQSVWATYRHDHPLYYWLLGQVVYNSKSLSLCVDSDYKYGADRVARNSLIYEAIDGYLDAVAGETSAYATAFAFHDMIINNIDYALDQSGKPETANWAHSILGVLTGNSAVCEGYAKAFALLLNASDVENLYVTGSSSKNEGHAWNMVKLDGAWYWYDLTWDDQPTTYDGIIYDYMCQPDTAWSDHTLSETGNVTTAMNFLYEIPAAALTAYNSSSVEYGERFTVENCTYEVCGYNKVSIVESSSLSGAVVLPESVTYAGRTYTLMRIGTNAFKNNSRITSLTIPATINLIYNFAFSGCSNLDQVIFEDVAGWSRTCNNSTEQIAQSSLQSATQAAKLLKQTYRVFVTRYEYTWIKSHSA